MSQDKAMQHPDKSLTRGLDTAKPRAGCCAHGLQKESLLHMEASCKKACHLQEPYASTHMLQAYV